MTSAEVYIAQSDIDIAAVKGVFLEYIGFIEAYLGQSLDFQGTEKEFADFPVSYDALVLGRIDGAAVGACGVKPFQDDICELKRLYCRPAGRGHNLGERLMAEALRAARQLGYKTIYLDTDPGLVHANKIYERLGFTDIERYYENPMGCSRYMALKL